MKRFLSLFAMVLAQLNSVSAQDAVDKKSWAIPDFCTVQYAGSIGFGSVGFGYNFMHEKTAVTFMYGYVPERFGGEIHTATLKYIYKPLCLKKQNVKWKVINPGLFLSNTMGKDFHLSWSEQYPKHYYWWMPSLRIHPSVSSELEFALKGSVKAISVYAEINSNDLYIASYRSNREWLSPYKIFKSGYGINVKF